MDVSDLVHAGELGRDGRRDVTAFPFQTNHLAATRADPQIQLKKVDGGPAETV